MHVYPRFSNYEDYLQERIILYAQMIENYSQLKQTEVDKLSFRKIIWLVTDQLRQCQKDSENCQGVDKVEKIGGNKDIDVILFIQEIFPKYSELERILIKNHFLQE